MAAAASIPVKHIDDITECPICKENFTDPRVLPCIHTYCLKCIGEWGKEAKPGDNVKCPLCRKQFTIPQQGFSGLPKNIVIDKLLDVKTMCKGTSAVPVLCDVCGTEKKGGSALSAKFHCVFCKLKQNLCEKCGECHNKLKVLSHHKLLDLADQSGIGKLLSELPTFCDEHKSEEVKMYCMGCEIPVCVMCYLESHNSHKCTDLKKISQQLNDNLLSDIVVTGETVRHCEVVIKQLVNIKTKLVAEFSAVEGEICDQIEMIKQFAEERKLKLFAQLEAVKQTKLKEVENIGEELESRLVEMKSFKYYCEEVESKGTACDVVRQTGGLRERATELQAFDPVDHVNVNFKYAEVTYKPSKVEDGFLDGVTGCLTIKDALSDTLSIAEIQSILSAPVAACATPCASSLVHVPTLAYVILKDNNTKGNRVIGITVLKDKLYVIRFGSKEIAVYDVDRHCYSHSVTLPGLSASTRGIASCVTNHCFYVSDYANMIVLKVIVDSGDHNTVTTLSVSYRPGTLSVAASSNILVVSEQEAIIYEYESSGTPVREIALESDITRPVYAIELPDKTFLLSHIGGSLHRVCILGADGKIIHSHGSSPGSDPGQLHQPRGIAVDPRNGHILVADRLNNRILVLDFSLNYIGVLPVSLSDPSSLCFDESRGQLCIGEFKPGTVKVFENVNIAT